MIYNDPMLQQKKTRKVTLTLMGTGDVDHGYIQIDGTKYYTPQTVEVEVGTEVYCVFLGEYGTVTGLISVNDETIQYGDSAPTGPYVYLAKVTATFNITASKDYYNLAITESTDIAAGGAIGN